MINVYWSVSIGLIVLILCVIIYVVILYKPSSDSATNKPIGGCAGTRYGCCPNTKISKHDELGSNCYKNNI